MNNGSFYSYSFDEEIFHGLHETQEAALIAAREIADLDNCPMGKTWIGGCTPVKTSDFMLCAEDVRNFVTERAGDACGESSEAWLVARFDSETTAKVDALLSQIAEVIHQTEPPAFYNVSNVIEHMLGTRP